MSNRRFDSSLAGCGGRGGWLGLALAVALGGCVDTGQQGFGQQGAGSGAATSGVQVLASGATAAPAAAASGTAVTAQGASAPAAASSKPAAPPAVVEPVVYRARRGDTLKRIAQKHGITVKQLLAWNRMKASARVKPGQTLIVSSPDAARNADAANATAAASASTPTGSS